MTLMSWWRQRSAREQKVLFGAFSVSSILLLYMLLIEPAWKGMEQRRVELENARTLLHWMHQSVAELESLQQVGGAARQQPDKPLYLLLSEQVQAAGLDSADQLSPVGRRGARLIYQEIAFDPFVQMLVNLLNRYQVTVTDLRLRRKEEGMVSVNLSLEGVEAP